MTEVDYLAIIVGPPKSGKTSIARAIVNEHLQAHAAGIALVHDTQRQFVDLCASYETVEEFAAAHHAARAGRASIARGSSFWGARSTPIAELASDLGRAHNVGAPSKRLPILLVWDETSVLDQTGSTYLGRIDNELATTRRHLGIALVYNCQRPSSLPRNLFELATDVYVLRLMNEDLSLDLERKLGLEKGQLAPMIGAKPFGYLHWRAGIGLV